jgi:drug/metabolite transporter (DMT)-like permease
MKPASDLASYAALTTAAVVWGGSIVGQKLALDGFSAAEVSVCRGIGALAILVPLWWWQEGGSLKVSRRDVWYLFALGLGVMGNHLLMLYGLQRVGAAAGGVIIGAGPAITALLSWLMLRDVPFRAVWLGCVISFGGVALVSGMDGVSGEQSWIGGLLIVLGLVSWALYTIGGRRAMDKFSPLVVNWTTLLCSIIVQIPLLWIDRKISISGLATVSIEGWVALAYLIVFATAIGQQAWLYGVQGIGPARAGIFVNLIPVSALILSAILLGEKIGITEIAGITLVLCGVWLVNWQSRRQQPQPLSPRQRTA